MSIEAMAVVLHHSRAKGTDKLILLGIANHMSDGGAWPTVETLARYGNVEERTVQRSVSNLVKLGELAVDIKAGGSRGYRADRRPNRYDVLVACPFNCDRTMNHRLRPVPETQADLWITEVTPTSPRGHEVTPTSPHEVTPTSPKPYIEPITNCVGENLTVPRARPHASLCDICSLSAEACISRAHISGHSFVPKLDNGHRKVEAVIEEYADEMSTS